MKRDRRLHGLSSEHHQALVLARRAARAAQETDDGGRNDVWQEVKQRFADELEPHFQVEERLLLPALSAAGETELVRRTEEDHAALRGLVGSDPQGHGLVEILGSFGARLRAHVRFEEDELFPACERELPDGVLDAVAAAAPKTAR